MTTIHPANEIYPPVHILLLNWHSWPDTIACLYSLATLDYPNFRVLVVDNGSTDDSVARIHATHPAVPIIETGHNLGFGGGCNIGIRHALGNGAEYVWLLNNDATADSHALAAMVEIAEKDFRIAAVGSVVYEMDSPKHIQAWGGGRVNLWTGQCRHLTAPGQPDYLTGTSLLLRAKALQEVGLFDEDFFMYWEDTDLSFRIRRAGWQLTVAQDAHVWHKGSATLGKQSPTLALYYNRSAMRFYRKHAPIPLIPSLLGTSGRVGKQLLRGHMGNALAVLEGAWSPPKSRQCP